MVHMIKNKPPLTVFLLCLICIVTTLFYFVYYIRTAELVPDSDKNYEWSDLLDHFNKEDSCLSDYAGQELNNLFDDSILLTTVHTALNIDASKFVKYNKIYGILSLTDWVPRCPKGRLFNKLKIRFDMPLDLKNFTGEVCAQIIGPQDYLPLFLKQGCIVKHIEATKRFQVTKETAIEL
ncbi:unnamed protein product [Callosobruchus maculatus]|uniref:TMEM248/TMEM219 domain-containing protein n=1 Tax=Callosobruchus maculatus TaxID=64391 RepID=A0A653DNV8_CALMS|nr:unnamed protein product [Callosobruchus maculatus]